MPLLPRQPAGNLSRYAWTQGSLQASVSSHARSIPLLTPGLRSRSTALPFRMRPLPRALPVCGYLCPSLYGGSSHIMLWLLCLLALQLQ